MSDLESRPLEDLDDTDLMRMVREGRREAFECLVRRHQQPLLNFFHRMGVPMHAEDMTQETLVRVFNYRDRYKPSAKFTTFLYTVARHVFLDERRKAKRMSLFAERTRNEAQASRDGGLREMSARLDVQAALERLPEKLRAVVVLNAQQGLKYDEIAGVLDIPVGTVKSRMFFALRQLREMFDDGPK
jgi:RNA polymerase sigma-70 factor (ECF subfamily)